MRTKPLWAEAARFPEFPKLTSDAKADVVVVGGGITGLTTGYLLSKAGRRVILLDRAHCAGADTGHTSAHLTMVTDEPLSQLVKRFGRDHARAAWDAGLAAIAQIEDIVRALGVDAGFARVEGYLHAPLDNSTKDTAADFEAEAALARELGFDAAAVDAVPLFARPGIRFARQARIHPVKYLAGLAQALVQNGGRIHEQTEAEDFRDEPRSLKANGHTITCDAIVVATHNPLVGLEGMMSASLFQTKLALYSSYVVAGRIPRHSIPDALWWDTKTPYHYVRVEPHHDHDYLIVGGEDHKTGQEQDTEACYARLETYLRTVAPDSELACRWSGQVIETPDGLPYIGETAERQYAATGFAGNGLTFGTLAAMMLSDAILGRGNPWTELFDPDRKVLTRGAWDYVKENADYPYYMARDRFAGADAESFHAVAPGTGRIVDWKGTKVAAVRDSSGTLILRAAECTHMGCLVAWNQAEQTWDCPCHGSRFNPDGEVIAGPAKSPLAPVE